jgi:hypothetical protein
MWPLWNYSIDLNSSAAAAAAPATWLTVMA